MLYSLRSRTFNILKRGISFLILFCIMPLMFSCDGLDNSKDCKIDIVAASFPEYDWIKAIIGDNNDEININLIFDTGTDLHSYQPTSEDIIKINSCDFLVYNGGESTEWIADVLKNKSNPDMVVVCLMDILGENVKKVKEDDSHNHNGADEHIWLSIKNAIVLCKNISEELCIIAPEKTALFTDNTDAYIDKLSALDNEYSKVAENSKVNTIVFGDRFPFKYLVEDYGIDYYAAFEGCSAEAGVIFDVPIFLAKKVDELDIRNIITIEGSKESIAKSIVNITKTKDQNILTLDSLQSITKEEINSGKSYLGVMESNLDVLKKALSNEDQD